MWRDGNDYYVSSAHADPPPPPYSNNHEDLKYWAAAAEELIVRAYLILIPLVARFSPYRMVSQRCDSFDGQSSVEERDGVDRSWESVRIDDDLRFTVHLRPAVRPLLFFIATPRHPCVTHRGG